MLYALGVVFLQLGDRRPDPSVGDTPVVAGEVEMERVPRPGSRVRGAVPDIITTQFIAATQASRLVSHVNVSTTCLCIKIGTLVDMWTQTLNFSLTAQW